MANLIVLRDRDVESIWEVVQIREEPKVGELIKIERVIDQSPRGAEHDMAFHAFQHLIRLQEEKGTLTVKRVTYPVYTYTLDEEKKE